MADFDPYHVWLGILPNEQPPNRYRLLGIAIYESNEDVIAHAADRQMLFVRQFQAGGHLAESQKLLNEIAAAKVCLLNATAKAKYDAALHEASISALAPAIPSNDLSNLSLPYATASKSEVVTRANEYPTSLQSMPPSPLRRSAIRLAGQVFASIVGVSFGLLILVWSRGDRPLNVTKSPPVQELPGSDLTIASDREQASQTISKPVEPKAKVAIPPNSAPVLSQVPAAVPQEATSIQETSAPAQSMMEQNLNDRAKALEAGNLADALLATSKIAQLEGQDEIHAQFEFLMPQATDSEMAPMVVEQGIVLIESALKTHHVDTDQIAGFVLATARQTKDSTLIRRATLEVLKVQDSK